MAAPRGEAHTPELTVEEAAKARAFAFDVPPAEDNEPSVPVEKSIDPVVVSAPVVRFERHLVLVDGQVLTDMAGRPVADPSLQEERADLIRTRLAPQPTAGQIKTPDQVIDDLEWAKHGVAEGARLIREAERAWKALKHELERRRAHARQRSLGRSADQRDADVYLQTESLARAVDDAETVLNYVRAVSRASETTTSAAQTQARMVEATFRLAGTGREA
ncbi:hypothetical protein [Microcella frigidaquae]|uniref:Uncharacterized protein n=1 Tax=Microcella frigidaquae TaxID=424758 RepID=A0A840XFX1_9MICO|nr:hypothetical protein [Microcella frigidaquae]MBB5617236.1 hypothetical protein [Microcella frigidaquae]NHN45064.1 hypothetical protein [Microcella frigidaquae]